MVKKEACLNTCSVFEHVVHLGVNEIGLHSKKRNRLAQQRLNDLVYVKYNRALMRRYNLCDTIDPIVLNDVDDSNEWLTGVMDSDGEDDNEKGLVWEDDTLTWVMSLKLPGLMSLAIIREPDWVDFEDTEEEEDIGNEQSEEEEEDYSDANEVDEDGDEDDT
uniref:HAT C-terminal dimerisation domain-containing protein n=1 Tax=Ananas comosus var. bracteatus TaxID=296719 RepID=A0A6V7Q3P2_ANACO|nr:unnamed protein product [Ananas comosus var. bracteatus]